MSACVEPFGYWYMLLVEKQLKAGGSLNEDLLVRLREIGTRLLAVDNSRETSLRRSSWCCYVVGQIVLECIAPDLADNLSPPELRPVLTQTKLAAFEAALLDALRASNIYHAEHAMSGGDALRNEVQIQHDRVLLGKKLAAMALVLIGLVRNDVDAGSVGQGLFHFLLEARKSNDVLVAFAEKMLEVHA
jgi:hypothetical protein